MAITINRQRWNVSGSYRDIMYDFSATAGLEVLTTPLHRIEHASVSNPAGVTNLGISGILAGSILMLIPAPPVANCTLRVVGL